VGIRRYIALNLVLMGDRKRPRLCEKSNIYLQISVAQYSNPFFVSLSEIVVVALKFLTLFLANISSLQRDLMG
jgi:hypothetical protein